MILPPDNNDLIARIRGRFYANFAVETARWVIETDDVQTLYYLCTCRRIPSLSRTEQEQVNFRAAYTLEEIYLNHTSFFTPYKDQFIADFKYVINPSVKRHFSKIMNLLLRHHSPTTEQCESIATTCIEWITEEKVRVAVQIRAVEILLQLQPRVEWLGGMLPQILEPLSRNPSPAMTVNLKRWKQAHKEVFINR